MSDETVVQPPPTIDEAGRIRTPISPATWVADEAAPQETPAKEPAKAPEKEPAKTPATKPAKEAA